MIATHPAEATHHPIRWAPAAHQTLSRQALISKDRALAALMQRAQRGSEGAYAQLLQELPPVLGRMICRQMAYASPSDREDVLQEVLLSIHAARATYDPARPFIPWLKAIVISRAIDFMRRQKRHAAGQLLTDEMADGIADEAAGEAVARYDAIDALQKAIRALPAGQRSAIELLKLKEMSLREAAAASGMSIGALKASVHRAVRTLRMSLAPHQAA
ncbi:MAG: sigma-70 family RNA polymerase sigma factor [Xanthobacteraceae bacterium]|nr:sigma-70 family RNA polymerase sigma factor [Xanthobacteraceae bacterium]